MTLYITPKNYKSKTKDLIKYTRQFLVLFGADISVSTETKVWATRM